MARYLTVQRSLPLIWRLSCSLKIGSINYSTSDLTSHPPQVWEQAAIIQLKFVLELSGFWNTFPDCHIPVAVFSLVVHHKTRTQYWHTCQRASPQGGGPWLAALCTGSALPCFRLLLMSTTADAWPGPSGKVLMPQLLAVPNPVLAAAVSASRSLPHCYRF